MAQYRLEGAALWESYFDPNFPTANQPIHEIITADNDSDAVTQALLLLKQIKLQENDLMKLISVNTVLMEVRMVKTVGFQSAKPAQEAAPEEFYTTPAS